MSYYEILGGKEFFENVYKEFNETDSNDDDDDEYIGDTQLKTSDDEYIGASVDMEKNKTNLLDDVRKKIKKLLDD